MRRILALTCATPVLLTALITAGTAAAGESRPARPNLPAPAASPPLGDEYFTSTQLARGLLTRSDLPAGYTAAGESVGSQSGYPVFGSGLCTGYESEIWESVSHASRGFGHPDGSTLRVSITATGSARAGQIVDHIIQATKTCPSPDSDGVTRKYPPLELPDLGRTAAGLIMNDGTTHAVAIAYGDVSAVFEETRGSAQSRARFLEIVRAGAGKLEEIDGPSSIQELKRGLITVSDLPAGHRRIAGGPVTGGDWFTEYNCAGALQRFEPQGTAVYRSFTTQGKRTATIRMAVGSVGTPGLAQAVRSRLARCPSVLDESGKQLTATGLPVPSSDITTVGILYPGNPAVARAIVEYRDWYTDVRITMTGDQEADAAAVEKIVTAAMVHIFKISG